MMGEDDLLALLRAEIPMSSAMGVSDLILDETSATLTLPLEPNRNHKGTLFGGSLYSASALACYALFLSGLRKAGVSSKDIVISEGSMRYLHPVTSDARVQAFWSSDLERLSFFQTLKAKGRAKVQMRARVRLNDGDGAEFNAYFACRV